MSHVRPYDSPPPPTDVRGTVECARWNGYDTAELIRMARQMAFDGGYPIDRDAPGGAEMFQLLHRLDLLLTCILDRVEADAEMLDRLGTHLIQKAERKRS